MQAGGYLSLPSNWRMKPIEKRYRPLAAMTTSTQIGLSSASGVLMFSASVKSPATAQMPKTASDSSRRYLDANRMDEDHGNEGQDAVTTTNAKERKLGRRHDEQREHDHVPADRKALEAIVLGLHPRIGIIDGAGDDDDRGRG